ncbi:hypothetical protein SAMN04488127_1413 [Bhargavaea ginsengi]|uniref:Uncharacterized protein n=1 Tax=Bhargavaea ginsengi TaxID=426757 RepID=A0A1H6X8X9_9BACL|nr:hypothetical protein SAMN04488127_1413 [Bhargavaea ginsengi]
MICVTVPEWGGFFVVAGVIVYFQRAMVYFRRAIVYFQDRLVYFRSLCQLSYPK